MSDATDLWTAVVTSYDADGLIELTNVRDRTATTVDTTAGQDAATSVLALWPAYAQVVYDGTNALHVEAAKQGVIAMLWRRGGSATTIEQVKWDEVFGTDGIITRVRRTGPRGHRVGSSNSGVTSSRETINGQRVRGWSDKDSLPSGYLPRRQIAED